MVAPLPPPIKAWLKQDLRPTIEFAQWAAGIPTIPTPVRAGDIQYWNGSAWATLPGNNSGTQFLQETSAGVPSWATPPTFTAGAAGYVPASGGGTANFLRADGTFAAPSGAMVLLNTLTANNSATLSDASSITGTYSNYLIVWDNLLPATTGVELQCQVHASGAFSAAGYSYAGNLNTTATPTSTPTGILSNSFFSLSGGAATVSNTASLGGISGRLMLFNPHASTFRRHVEGKGVWETASDFIDWTFSGAWNNAANAIDGFQILFSSGNIISGTVKIYGIS